jgi:AcrR family transcriptional regulator
MPRTVNVAVHQVRREAFLGAAQHLIQTKGYEEMSVQDVIDALETSRGAFYHYFDSKQALLEAVVRRIADAGMLVVSNVMSDPTLPAIRKVERVFGTISDFKAEQVELMVALAEVWRSDGNAIVREKLRRLSASLIGPILAAIVKQGVEEGAFQIESPDETATILIALIQSYQQLAAEQFLGRQDGTVTWDTVQRTCNAVTEAFERILGIPAGSVTLMNRATLHFWFG